jgi:hypothetical protein
MDGKACWSGHKPVPEGRSFHAPAMPLSQRLSLLVGAVAVPLMLLGAATLWLNYEESRAQAEARLVEQARSTALLVDAEFARVQATVATLSTSGALLRRDRGTFEAELRAARDTFSEGLPLGGGTAPPRPARCRRNPHP